MSADKISCSVCALSRPQAKGGILLWERNGKLSAICEECWDEFSNVPNYKRIPKTQAQEEALKVSEHHDFYVRSLHLEGQHRN